MNSKKIFIADKHFIPIEIKKKYNFISVFPCDFNDGAYRETLDGLVERSKKQSTYYEKILPEIIPIFEKYMPSAGQAVEVFVRPFLMTITSIYIDRCLRVIHQLQVNDDKSNLYVAQVESRGEVQFLSEIVQDWRLNQEIIQKIMNELGFNVYPIFSKDEYPEFRNNYSTRNLLFTPPRSGLPGVFIKIQNRVFNILDKFFSKKANLQSLGFGPDKFYLAKRGLIGPNGFFKSLPSIHLLSKSKNNDLRKKLLNDLQKRLVESFENLLLEVKPNIELGDLKFYSNAYLDLIIDWFPVSFLEGLEDNLKSIHSLINFSTVKGVIGHDTLTDVGLFMCASAHMNNKEITGVQHGGHYGYIEDMSVFSLEFGHYDKMITWGWDRIDSHLFQCETIPLPVPKLSEMPLKSDYLSSLEKLNPATKDVLFFANLFHRFPHISTCGQSRVDFIDEIKASQENLMQALRENNISIDHKPYNMKYIDLYPEHYKRLEQLGGSGYSLIQSIQKGLSIDLIKTCKIVLWDQIGSGTLECFTSQVPTIIFWERIYSKENDFSKNLIENLERCGVIHSDPNKLAKEIKNYLENPKDWMDNADRKSAIKEFCQKFALTDPQWYKSWKKYLLSS